MSKAKQNKTSSGKSSTPAEDVYLCLSVAVSGRCPFNGNILSLAAVACTKQRKILGLYSCNMTPLPGGERLTHKDVFGFWQSKPRELEEVCAGPLVSPLVALQGLQGFCKPFGRCTLVGSPLLSCYGWLAHYWNVLLPGVAMPWGFSGVCARSFASGVLGVSMQNLAQHPAFLAAHPVGLATNGVPANDAVISACVFTQMLRLSLKLDDQLDGPSQPTTAADALPAEPATTAVRSDSLKGLCRVDITFLDDKVRAAVEAATAPLDTSCERYPISAAVAAAHVFQEYPSITDPTVDPLFTQRAAAMSTSASSSSSESAAAAKVEEEDVEWVVTEKVHGSNFSFICKSSDATAKDGIVCGKRTSVLHSDEVSKFFQFDRLLASERGKLAKCYALVENLLRPLSSSHAMAQQQLVVAVVGELAGGEYVHPQVPLDLRGIRVQNGIQYHPNNFFYAFDIAYTYATMMEAPHDDFIADPAAAAAPSAAEAAPRTSAAMGEGGDRATWTFLPFDDAQRIFSSTGLFCAAPLFRGSVREALAFNPVIPTTIPGGFGLPSIPENFAEGVVARPVRDLLQGGSRLMAKLKHPKFSEFSHFSADCPPLEMLTNFSKNDNRIESVKSKLTEAERASDARVAAETVVDALVDVRKLHPAFECTVGQLANAEGEVLALLQRGKK
jgi:hypothetical protein